MNTLSKLFGIGLLAASSLALAAEPAIPGAKDPAADAVTSKGMVKGPKAGVKPTKSNASQRWSKNQEDLSILKQELEIRQLQKKISDAEGVTAGALASAPLPEGEVLKGGISSSEIFVDRVFGIEDALQARVFFNSHIMTVSVNDEVADGIVVTGINSRGISLRAGKGKIAFIPLTTTSMAAEKAFPSGTVMGVAATAPVSGGMELPQGAFPAGVLGLDNPPSITTGP